VRRSRSLVERCYGHSRSAGNGQADTSAELAGKKNSGRQGRSCVRRFDHRSRDGQDAFNVVKGSIPPRSDANVSRYDAYLSGQSTALTGEEAAGLALPPAILQGFEGLCKIQDQFGAAVGHHALRAGRGAFQYPIALDQAARILTRCELPILHT